MRGRNCGLSILCCWRSLRCQRGSHAEIPRIFFFLRILVQHSLYSRPRLQMGRTIMHLHDATVMLESLSTTRKRVM